MIVLATVVYMIVDCCIYSRLFLLIYYGPYTPLYTTVWFVKFFVMTHIPHKSAMLPSDVKPVT